VCGLSVTGCLREKGGVPIFGGQFPTVHSRSREERTVEARFRTNSIECVFRRNSIEKVVRTELSDCVVRAGESFFREFVSRARKTSVRHSAPILRS